MALLALNPAAKNSRVVNGIPTSLKTWAVAGARTALATGLSSAGFGVAGKSVEELIHRAGYRRIIIGLALAAALAVLTVTTILVMSVVVAEETILKPVSVVASVMGKLSPLFGGNEGKDISGVPRHLCKPVPSPGAGATPSGGDPSPFIPLPALDTNGRMTPETARLMREVPRGAQVLQAETWMMYVMSHPKDDPLSNWNVFAVPYEKALHHISAVKSARTVAVTPIEIAMRIDPSASYDPFELAAASMASSLILENEKETGGKPDHDPHIVRYNEEQIASVTGRMMSLC